MCSFTTHTPIESGHDRFDYGLVSRILDTGININIIKQLASEDCLNMTRLALNLSEYVNGVATSHANVFNKMFPGYNVHAISNGVHPYTWTTTSFSRLFDEYIPGWCHEPERLIRAECCIRDEEIWAAHQQAKQRLIEKVEQSTGVKLDPNLLILGFARRMTAYKRPDLLFYDIERLKKIASLQPLQIVFGGKAHPSDEGGKALIAELHHFKTQLKDTITTVYLNNYDLDTALTLISGSDLWLNTPFRPYEASGTSGMKAAFNGIPSLSVLDGWWIDGCIEGITGWSIGGDTSVNEDDAYSLYEKLENTILPLYYHTNRAGWIKVMKYAISKNASYFNSHRMMRRYLVEAYSR